MRLGKEKEREVAGPWVEERVCTRSVLSSRPAETDVGRRRSHPLRCLWGPPRPAGAGGQRRRGVGARAAEGDARS